MESLLQLSPSDLRQQALGALLLLVKVPHRPPPGFTASLEHFTLRDAARPSLTGIGLPTTELPAVQREPDRGLEPDQVGLLAELEDSVHCVVPLGPAPGSVRLGRSRTNALVLRDDSVSQTHAEIFVQDDGVSIVDLGSKNGTWVNGARVQDGAPRWLQPMDRLQFGRVEAFTCAPAVLRSVLRHRLRQLL